MLMYLGVSVCDEYGAYRTEVFAQKPIADANCPPIIKLPTAKYDFFAVKYTKSLPVRTLDSPNFSNDCYL